MPRARPAERYSIVATPHKAPIKLPLNDDRREKANRIRNSGTPARSRLSLAAQTPHSALIEDGMVDVVGTAVTPMKRAVPLLANFEEWMKLATDNKINATNSWNFALIDYFHDMTLLKEGDGVNFQKASCTLDGCVKIYTSRVDSVATDTGKLLSGLAESGNKKRRGQEEDGEGEDEDGEEGEDGQKKRKKRTQRSAEATLASSLAQLQNKKMEMDLVVDPLFKKATADFDEGGAKGLLLNHLSIDSKGRIVFDSSDDVQDATAEDTRETPAPEDAGLGRANDDDLVMDDESTPSKDIDIDLSGLAMKYFPDLSLLDEQDVCPSLKTFDLGDASSSTDLPFLKAPDDWRQDEDKEGNNDEDGNRSGVFLDDDNGLGFDDDVDLGGFDLPPETGFGEGGEAWARDAALDTQGRVHIMGVGDEGEQSGEGLGEGTVGTEEDKYKVTLTGPGRGDEHENILSYFDTALKKNWAGPEHWRVRRIKDIGKATPTVTKRKEKEPFEIDFLAPMSQSSADALYTSATSNSTISLPKAQWKSKTRNLLPDDKHFNSKQLLRLFLKPNARTVSRREAMARKQSEKMSQQQRPSKQSGGEVDEAYWATQENEANGLPAEEDANQGNYNADFFQDDGLDMPGGGMDDDDEDFADARDHFSPPADEGMGLAPPTDAMFPGTQEGAFGTQLVTQSRRFRPEYVQYARVAKKVDVRRLKEELWRGIGFKEDDTIRPAEPTDAMVDEAEQGTLKFTDVVNSLQAVYPKKVMADISTSYCFICLLHLANEKGLVINNEENFEDLSIRRDFTADLSVGMD
ncbi:barren [Pleomassaria siparia CBS 279.74]|uniref:Condensin complex subunit 2 n=1 Tax=Pleomassaria siparia CBS 279.74 TaxID=1314801 RepID=A0A6G1K3P3_9PLEO|nr:barren [Pleomassaria siparia CBS 279.74]